MTNNDDKKNPNAVEDFKDGLKGNDQKGLFSDRSKENEEGLKKKAELDEEEKREDKKTEEEKEAEQEEEDEEDENDEEEYRSPLLD